MRRLTYVPLLTVAALCLTTEAHAQRAPAIPGVTGTIVTEETARQEKKAADKAAAAVKDLVTPEDKGPLSDLRPGTTVVIRYKTDVTEGIVSKVDRAASEITVRYDNKKVETFVLADKASAETRTVEYTDEARRKVTRYFKAKS